MATASAGGAEGPFAATSLALGDARVAARLPKPDCAFGPDRTGPNRTGPDRAGPGRATFPGGCANHLAEVSGRGPSCACVVSCYLPWFLASPLTSGRPGQEDLDARLAKPLSRAVRHRPT